MANPAIQTEKGQNLKDTPKEEKAVASAAHAAAVAAAKKERSLPDPCGKSELSKINIALHNFMTALKGIKQYGELYVMGTINKLQNLTTLIRNTSKIVGAVLKILVNRLRDFLIDKIHTAISKLIDKLLPQIAKSIKNTIIQVVVDNIFCAFKDIIKNLANLAVDFLKEMVEKVINVPFCAAQQFTNALVNNVAALVDTAVGPILEQINDVLGGVGKIVGSVFQALDFILGFESFLCAAPNCPEITKFKASPWGGPSKSQVDAFDDFLAPLGGRQTPTADSIIKGATKFIDGIEIFGDELGDSAGAAGQSLNTACKELTKASQCGPPKVEIFGGGGIGAIGEVVVDDIGRTVGVNLLNRGSGYIRPPFVSFVDSCEDTLLSGYAIINVFGEVERIVIRTPVMVPRNDGRTELDPVDYCSIDSDCPEGQICLNGICVDEDTDPTSGSNEYGRDYVVCLYGIEVLDTGIGYTVNDSITITPNIPNLVASVQMTEQGQIIAVNLADPICGIPGYPEITITSNSGYSCILRPILEFIRIEEFNESEPDTDGDTDGDPINIDTDFTINAEINSDNREGLISTLRGRKLLTENQNLDKRNIIRIVDCIS